MSSKFSSKHEKMLILIFNFILHGDQGYKTTTDRMHPQVSGSHILKKLVLFASI